MIGGSLQETKKKNGESIRYVVLVKSKFRGDKEVTIGIFDEIDEAFEIIKDLTHVLWSHGCIAKTVVEISAVIQFMLAEE